MLLKSWLDALRSRAASLGLCRSQKRAGQRRLRTRGRDGTVLACGADVLETRVLLSADPVLLKDVNIAGASSSPLFPTDVNGTLYFTANDGTNGIELWKSDGTAAGTVLVKDINPGTGSSIPESLTNVNGTLFFSANDGANGRELWTSDGTAAGTVLVMDINPGTGSSEPGNLTYMNGTLYFRANNSTNGVELWNSDGTAAGTVLVKDIRAGNDHGSPQLLTNVNGTLFFSANDGASGTELWTSDGTAAGTVLVTDINLGTGSSGLANLTNVNGTLLFSANDGANGTELWTSDGTAAGTVLVIDINPGTGSSLPSNLTIVNGMLYFRANDGTSGDELWRSDGTAAGTVLVTDINPGTGSSFPANLTNVNGTLYFRANDGTSGNELWRSDGTAAGTVLVKDILPGSADALPATLANVNGTLFFRADDGTRGIELWRSDGTAAGTVLVSDINLAGGDSSPSVLTNVNGTLFFAATESTNGLELWKSDGTEPGTVLVKNISAGSSNSGPQSLMNWNGTLFFRASDGTSGTELWKSDGTAAGTVLFKDINPGTGSSSFADLTIVDGTLAYFTASDGTNGNELWKSDGTAAGTVLVKDINLGSGSGPSMLTIVNGTLYFVANDGTNGRELWKSDGTAAGTLLVKDILAGSSGSIQSLTNVNGTLFFTSSDGTNGSELWTSDGTAAGTVLVKDINPGAASSSPGNLTNVNGTLYFRATNGAIGFELWKSDGTAAGTVLVKDHFAGGASSLPELLTNVNGTLYFTASDGTNGRELWKSDGTAAGTVLVKDVNPGTGSSGLANLTNVNGTLYFVASDGTNGIELWKSDGTAAGTVLVKDIVAGSNGSNPQQLTNVDGALFFTANDGVHGTEPWILRFNDAPTAIALSNDGVSENEPAGTVVGTLSSTDPDAGDTFIYTFVAGTGDSDNASFQIVGDSLRSTTPFDIETQSSYSIRVRSTDQSELFFETTFTISVTPVNDHNPAFTSTSSPNVPENTAAVLTVTATDADLPGQTATFSLSGGADQGLFSITPEGVLSFVDAPDYEIPTDADGDNVYLVEVSADDGEGGLTTQTLSVTVTPVNDNAPVFTSTDTPSVPENASLVVQLTATDADLPWDRVLFHIVGGADQNKFDLDGNGVLSMTPPDFELPGDADADNVYVVEILAYDSLFGTGPEIVQTVYVTVTPVNDAQPNFTSSATPSVPENTTAVLTVTSFDDDLPTPVITYSLTGGDDLAEFSITPTGELSFLEAPDFEAPFDANADNVYVVEVTADDGDGGVWAQLLEVTVTPVNDNLPVITSPDTASVGENTKAVLTVTATDADLPGQTVTFSLSGGADQGLLAITPEGVLSFISPPDFEVPADADGDNVYLVQVTSDDGLGATAVQELSVHATPVNDNAPVITSHSMASVPENSTAVLTVTATDADLPAQTVTFSLSLGPADAGLFTLTPEGALSFNGPPDYENPADANGNNVYVVFVAVNDGGFSTNQLLSVHVTPVNDNVPVFTSPATASVPENSTAVLTVAATDADLQAQTVTFSLSGGADQGLFTITPEGVLSFVSPPDFEAPADADGDNVYLVQVTSDDGLGATAVQELSVSVTPVNDHSPVFTSPDTASVPENTTVKTLAVSAHDEDSPKAITYALTGGDDLAQFTITPKGSVSFLAVPDFEAPSDANADNVYVVEVTADDGEGGLSTQTLSVTVTPVNDNAPVFTSTQTPAVPENTTAVLTVAAADSDLPAQTVTFSLSGGADQGRFTITPEGILSFVEAPDYENPSDADADNAYVVEVTASDGDGGVTTQTLFVAVTDVGEAPVLDIQVLSATANGATTLTVVYTILGEASPAFTLGAYRSEDAAFGSDALLGTVTISAAVDLSVGLHSKSFTIGSGLGQIPLPGAGVAEVDGDYHLLFVADPLGAIAETDSDSPGANNVAAFSGVYHAPLGPVLVQGRSSADVVAVTGTTTLTVTLNGTSFIYPAADVVQLRVRTHGGADAISAATAVSKPLFAWGGADNDTLTGGSGADVLSGGSGNDILTGNGSGDSLAGDAGDDALTGGAGNDAYLFDADSPVGSDTLNESGGGIDLLDFSATTELGVTVDLNLATSQFVNANLSLSLGSASTFENVNGGAGNDTLLGNSLANSLSGGAGDDTYRFDADSALGTDTLNESGGGIDTLDLSDTTTVGVAVNLGQSASQNVHTNLKLILGSATTIENVIGGALNDSLTGNVLDNVLTGGDGNDSLTGLAGNDTLAGGAGDDTYQFVADANLGSDSVIEATGGGSDLLNFAATTLAVTVDLSRTAPQTVNGNLTLALSNDDAIEKVTGGGQNDVLIGNLLANLLTGGSGNDTLTGLAGDDILAGGAGNDTYLFDAGTSLGSDSLQESAGADTLDFSATTTMGVSVNLSLATAQTVNDNLTLTLGSASAFENVTAGSGDDALIGNALANTLSSGAGSDSLEGGAGNDALSGGAGDDTYRFDANSALGTDTLNESGGGIDTLDLSDTTTVGVAVNLGQSASQNVNTNLKLILGSDATIENAIGGALNDSLTGNALDNVLTGGDGNDSLTGLAGNDTLAGGAGDDTYQFVADANLGSDSVIEATGGGSDLLNFAATTMVGIAVNLSHASPQVVNTNLTLALSGVAVIEDVTGGSMDDVLTGNGQRNTLNGGSGNDILTGLAGDDTLIGGAGNDTFLFDADTPLGTDTLQDISGTDTLDFAATLTQSVTVNLSVDPIVVPSQLVNEHLSLKLTSATSFENAVGGALGDTLTGNSLNNTLTGGDGNDSLIGGAGIDTLNGDAADDTLIGGAGNDALFGGDGDDVYRFDADSALGTDTLNESDGGIDTLDLSDTTAQDAVVDLGKAAIQTVNANLKLTLGSDATIENVVGGALDDTLTGNALGNVLRGGDGNDTLAGLAGDDSLFGGSGSDTYQFRADADLGSDSIFEATGGGFDLLNFSSTTALGVAVDLSQASSQEVNDNLTLTLGSNVIEHVTGGGGNDVLAGNGQNNTLDGGSGDDTLIGLAGNDTLIGGAGNDTYVFGADLILGTDTLVENNNGGSDTLDFSATLSQPVTLNLSSISTQNVNGNGNLYLSLNSPTTFENAVGGAQGDTLTGNSQSNTLTGGPGSDTLAGGLGNDTYVFDADSSLGSDTVSENNNSGVDTLDFSATTSQGVTIDLGLTNVQEVNAFLHLRLISSLALENVVGGSRGDTLTGNSLNNTISGGPGNDTFFGGSGNDTYVFDADSPLGTDNLNDSGGGNDTLDFSPTTSLGVAVNLGLATTQTVNANLTLRLNSPTAIESVVGGAQADTITGNVLNNTLTGGGGGDTLAGGAGNDTYLFDADTPLGSDVVAEVAGIDHLSFAATASMAIQLDLASVIAQIVNSNLTLTLSDGGAFENVTGGSLGDTLTGNALANTLIGNGGNDSLSGGAGNDVLTGGAGNDALAGGEENDTYLFDADLSLGTDTLDEVEGEGIDLLDFSATTSVGIQIDLASTFVQNVLPFDSANLKVRLLSGLGFEMVVGTSHVDNISGNALDNVLIGGAAGDTLRGFSGRDLLIGGSTSDNFGGMDRIFGGDDDDILVHGNVSYFNESDGVLNRSAIDAIMAEWTRTDEDHAVRVSHLRTGGGLNGSTILIGLDDDSHDLLDGGNGLDWFLYDAELDSIGNIVDGESYN
ncbi:MAG: ELWxxDGT repeat protein [Planctomycetales bacterium]